MRILDLGKEDHCGDDVGLEGGLLIQRVAVAVEHGRGDLAGFAGNVGDVGGQAMEIERLAVLGELHHFLGAFPVLMLGVLREEPLFERLDAIEVAVAVQLRALLHGLKGRPRFRVDDIGVLERFLHIVRDRKVRAGLFAVLLRDLHDIFHDLIALRVGEGHVHAEPRKQPRDALRHRQRLAVGRAVCPRHGDLLALEVLDRLVQIVAFAERVDAMQHVRHALRRVVDIALEVDQRGLLFEHARLVALGHGVDDVVHIRIALADVHIVADADDVGHEGDHVRGLAHRFAVRDLALALVEILHLKAEEVARRREREARAGGVIAEQRNAEAGIKDFRGDIVLPQVTQRVGHGEHGGDLIVGLFPR